MRRLTTFIAVIFAAAAFAPLRAQSLDAFKERLAAPVVSDAAFGTARVTVTEYGDAEKAVDDASRVGQRLRLRGYRVCIFFDNGQDARAGAFAAEALFKETYPGIMVYPVYENPYFKVVVGNCLTAEDISQGIREERGVLYGRPFELKGWIPCSVFGAWHGLRAAYAPACQQHTHALKISEIFICNILTNIYLCDVTE